MRYWAFQGLIALRGADRELLRAGLVDREPTIRLTAAERLLTLGSDAVAVDTLEGLAAEASTRARVLMLLSTNGDPRRTAIVARSLLPKSEDLTRIGREVNEMGNWLTAIHTLQVVQDREAVPAVGALLGPEQNINLRGVRALVAIGDDAARRTRVRAPDSAHSAARIHAAGGGISVYAR